MEYLNTTIVFLQQQNQELKEKLKRIENLQNIINDQMNQEQKDCLARLHRQQIGVIREMAAQTENTLRKQIKHLKNQVQELTESLLADEDTIMMLKHDLNQKKSENSDMQEQIKILKGELYNWKEKYSEIDEEYGRKYLELENSFQQREEEIMKKYLERIENNNEKYQQELMVKNGTIQGQLRSLELIKQQKKVLEEEIERLVIVVKEGDRKNSQKSSQKIEQNLSLKKENERLKLNIQGLEFQIFELGQNLKEEKKRNKVLEQQKSTLKKELGQLQHVKDREIMREKSKTISVCKDLTEHKKYLKTQMETSKRKQKEFALSKKMLINRIKESQSKPSSCKSHNTSFLDKTAVKTSKKTAQLQSCQSISLNNSMNKDSPSVSSFNLKSNSRAALSKKPLTIQTSDHQTLLRFESLDTPCFESAKEITKKTIKIRK